VQCIPSTKADSHEIFSSRFVFFVVKKEFLCYPVSLMKYVAALVVLLSGSLQKYEADFPRPHLPGKGIHSWESKSTNQRLLGGDR